MSPARDLPARPSLDSLRKQAKRLARESADRDAVRLPLRDAQLVIAREYGFDGWRALVAEVQRRTGNAIDWAAAQAQAAIQNRDNDRLRELLADYPALLTWRSEAGASLVDATTSYALDNSDPERERLYNRPDAAEILIDRGAQVEGSTREHVIATGAAGMLHLFARKGVLPPTLPMAAALGDADGVRARLHESPELSRALMNACRFRHSDLSLHILDRMIALDPALGRRIDAWGNRGAFVEFLIRNTASHWSGGPVETPDTTVWQAFLVRQLTSSLDASQLETFREWLRREPWILEGPFVRVQIAMLERASWQDRAAFMKAILDSNPALLQVHPPPASSAIVFALEYGHAKLVPMLTRVWPVPDDLPHAAGMGDAASVARWFDATGRPVLGSLANHFSPARDPQRREDLHWGPVSTQQVLDVALAWACVNRQFEIASFLLDRGADINTTWSTHEPASILHECAIRGDEEAVRFLIGHGADLTAKDFRYRATAEGWARYAAHDDRMADLLAAAAQARP